MTVLRSTTFQLHVKNEDGTTKMKSFARAVTDADETVKRLNEELGENVEVTYNTARSTAELTQQARMLVTQQEKANRVYQSQVEQLRHQINLVGKSAEEQAALNAQFILGANATEQQRQEVADLARQYSLLLQAQDQTGGSMRNLRGIAQNFGWQLQDTVVQLQMGTNWMTVLSQQGSQMASAFGATGAIVGAAIAILGAVMPTILQYLGETKTTTDELAKAQEYLNSVFEVGGYTIKGFTKDLQDLYKVDAQLAELKMQVGILEAEKIIKNASETIKSMLGDIKDLGKGFRWVNSIQEEFDEDVEDLAKKYGLQREAIIQLGQAYHRVSIGGPIDKFVEQIKEISVANPKASAEFKRLALEVSKLGLEAGMAEAQIERIKKIIEEGLTPSTLGLDDALKKTIKSYQDKTLALQIGERAYAIYNEAQKLEIKQGTEQYDQLVKSINAYFDEKEAVDKAKEAKREATKEAERYRRETEKFNKELDKLIGKLQNPWDKAQDEWGKFDEMLNRALNEGKISLEEFVQYSDALFEDFADNVAGLFDSVKPQDITVRLNTDILETFEQLYEQLSTPINDMTQLTQRNIVALANVASNQLTVMSSTASMFSSVVDEIVNGGARIKEQVEEMNGVQKAAFFFMRAVKAAEAYINGVALGSQLAVTLGWGAPAGVAFGNAIGGAQAGAIMGTTFAGFFDEGGYIPSGQKGIVAEYGNELVNGVMVEGPARVTSREDTAKMMSRGMTVNVTNNAPGVEHEVRQIDEDTVEIIAKKVFNENLDRGVSGVLGRKGSRTNRTLTKEYSTTNKY